MADQVIRKSVSFEKRDFQTVQQTAKLLGKNGFSAAVRMIIREWAEMKANQRVMITEPGRQALHENDCE